MKTRNNKPLKWKRILSIGLAIVSTLQTGNALAWSLRKIISVVTAPLVGSNATINVASNSPDIAPTTGTPSTKPWVMSYEHIIASMPLNDMVIPIETRKPTVVMTHPDLGSFSMTDGVMTSVTRTPIVVTPAINGSYNYRPTLYITLRGYPFNLQLEVKEWQHQVEQSVAIISGPASARYSQYVVMSVDWDAEESFYTQLDDLSNVVKGFLNDRAYPWDVVIIGHSRGGIFAHQLAEKIHGHQKVNNLHTFLLDPSAATFLGDRYPLYGSSSARDFRSLFYDGQGLAYANILTVGDKPIPGYTNYGLGVADQLRVYRADLSHPNYPDDWVADTSGGLERAFTNIWNNKSVGSFSSDGDSRFEVVRIRS